MENRENQSPATGEETDLTKAQNQQQPSGQQGQQQPQGQHGQSEVGQDQQQPESQADYGSAGQSDTATQQRTDIEGGTSTGQASDIEGSSQFVGSQSGSDTSSELIEEDDEFSPDRQSDGE